MLSLLLLAAGPQTAVEAERAFAARAATTKQWAAFREYSTPDAVMFVPQPVNAHEWLAKQPEPPIAVQWWPAESYVSCDGATAVNTGPWAIPSARLNGFFTTVWRKGPDGGWKWVYDAGGPLDGPQPVGAKPLVKRASCRNKPVSVLDAPDPGAVRSADGASGDGTLEWRWTVGPDGARGFDAFLWNGREMVQVVEDRVEAPPKRG